MSGLSLEFLTCIQCFPWLSLSRPFSPTPDSCRLSSFPELKLCCIQSFLFASPQVSSCGVPPQQELLSSCGLLYRALVSSSAPSPSIFPPTHKHMLLAVSENHIHVLSASYRAASSPISEPSFLFWPYCWSLTAVLCLTPARAAFQDCRGRLTQVSCL